MVSINREAMKLVREIITDADRLGIKVNKMNNGATVIDMGVNVPGSWEAGLYYSRITMGNLGKIELVPCKIGSLDLTGVSIYSDRVVTATIGSQIAGWKLSEKGFIVIGSGPARAQAVVEGDYYFEMTDYRDHNEECVLCLQMPVLPEEEIGKIVAESCKVSTANIYLVIAPSASLVGSIQVAARSIEQVVHKMFEHDFNLNYILFARGIAPVAPLIEERLEAMGRINDSLLYGGLAEFWVKCKDSEIKEIINKLVTGSSRDYGRPFAELFVEADEDFFKMDKDIHAIAKLKIQNTVSGNAFEAGRIYPEVIKKSFTGKVL